MIMFMHMLHTIAYYTLVLSIPIYYLVCIYHHIASDPALFNCRARQLWVAVLFHNLNAFIISITIDIGRHEKLQEI